MTDEQKKAAQGIHKALKGLAQTLQILKEDVRFAEQQLNLHKKSHEQTCRRTLIRCVCAYLEATLSLMKAATLPAADFFSANLSDEEMEVASGHRVKNRVLGKRAPFSSFPDNVKRTLGAFAKAHAVSCVINYDDAGFCDLCETYGLRNRLMHPKTHLDIEVSNKAFETSIRGFNWFDSAGVRIMKDCKEKVTVGLVS